MSALQLPAISTVENKPAPSGKKNESSPEELRPGEEKPFNQQLNEEIEKVSETTNTGDAESNEDSTDDDQQKADILLALESAPGQSTEEEKQGQLTGKLLPPAAALEQQIANDNPAEKVTVSKNSASPVLSTETHEKSQSQAVLADQKMTSQTSKATESVTDIPLEETPVDEALDETVLKTNEAKKTTTDNAVVKTELSEFTKVLKTTNAGQLNTINSTTTVDNTQKDASTQLSQQLQVATPLNNKQWGHEFAHRIGMMIANSQQQTAELQLNPARLGPLSVKLHIEDDKANISFVTHHHSVKEAIEVSLPRLKEQLEQQGLDMGHVDVSSHENEHTGDRESASEFMSGFENSDDDSPVDRESVIQFQADEGVSIFV